MNTRKTVQKLGIGNILRNVLVEIGSAVVDPADIAPGEIGGNIGASDVVLGLGRGYDLLQRVAGRLVNFGVQEPVSWPQGGGCSASCKSQKQGTNCETHADENRFAARRISQISNLNSCLRRTRIVPPDGDLHLG